MSSDPPIFSTIFDEYDLDSRSDVQVILDDFTRNWLPEKQQEITDTFKKEQWDSLNEILHVVKGAAGGYGYGLLTDLSKSIEDKIRAQEYDHLPQLISDLNIICSRIYAGNKP